jgi:hypothetical protein
MSSVASSFSGGFQSYAEGLLAGRIAERQAQATEIETKYAEEQSRKKTKALLGRQRTLYAKAGVSLSEGSPLEIMSETAAEGEREALMIKRQGTEQAKGFRWYGKVARKAGRMAFYSGMTSGGLGIASMVAGGYAGASGGGGFSGGTSGAFRSG